MREHNRFIRGMTSWVGFKQTGVYYDREARHAGATKYPLRKMVRFALDAITSFSYFPLQILLMSSFQLFFLFILGQYLARTYDEVRNRPLYVVASRKGFVTDSALPPPQVGLIASEEVQKE
jgi:dolichol-phosphate mannosyltransferase